MVELTTPMPRETTPAVSSPKPPSSLPRQTLTDYHVCVDIRGVLKNWNARELRSAFGMPADKARDLLMDELAKGRKVLPTSGCDNFDYQEGCLGHPREERGHGKETAGCGPLKSPANER